MIENTRAETEVRAVLGETLTLGEATEWMDCAKGFTYCHKHPDAEMHAYAAENPAHHAYHYTDVPFQRVKYTPAAAGAGPNDVVHARQDAIRVLRGEQPADPAHRLNKRTALFILAHMVGDIHQPLHVGAAYVNADLQLFNAKTKADVESGFTQGGNLLCIGSKGLHSNWDTGYVKSAMKLPAYRAQTPDEFADALLADPSLIRPEDTGDALDWPTQWATESLKVSRGVLFKVKIVGTRVLDNRGGCGTPGSDTSKLGWTIELPSSYRKSAVDAVPQRLLSAGVRLAAVLQAIWPD